MLIRAIIARMRHDGCGGRAGKVELMTGIDGASSRPVRKIVLRAEAALCSLQFLAQLKARRPGSSTEETR